MERGGVKGLAHITGGGLTENIPRCLPEGLAAELQMGAWDPPPVFQWIQKVGRGHDDIICITLKNLSNCLLEDVGVGEG